MVLPTVTFATAGETASETADDVDDVEAVEEEAGRAGFPHAVNMPSESENPIDRSPERFRRFIAKHLKHKARGCENSHLGVQVLSSKAPAEGMIWR